MKCIICKMKSFWILFVLCLLPMTALAQSISVSGTVKDASGETIPGANVVQKGTTNGVLTDFDGNFTIKVDKGATLVVSYIGYETVNVVANGGRNLEIVLREDRKLLNDVVDRIQRILVGSSR